MNSGDTHVTDSLHGSAVGACHESRFRSDGLVAGPGGDDGNRPGGRRQSANGDTACGFVEQRIGELGRYRRDHLVGESGGERRTCAALTGQRGQQRDDLSRRLAGCIDDLGVAGAERAMSVEPSETQIREAGGRKIGDGRFRVRDARGPGCDRVEQRGELGPVHGSTIVVRKSLLGSCFVLLDRPLLDEIAIAAGGLAVVATVTGLAAHARISRLRRGFASFSGSGKQTVLDAVRDTSEETKALRSELAQARTQLENARRDISDALRHVAVVRYDAFGDMGGRLSFTAALLDDAGDGLVITSIHARSEARTYAKGVKSGSSDTSLSPEEQQAIQLALRGPKQG